MLETKDILQEMEARSMDEFDAQAFRQLDEMETKGICLTMILPMETKGAETRKNHIVFKNALSQAQDALTHEEREHESIGVVLEGLQALDEPDHAFWQEQGPGLALIATSDRATAIKLPFSPEIFVWKDEKPYLSPLLRSSGTKETFVLVLDLNELRAFRGDQWQLQEVSLEDMPTSLDEAMKYDDPEKSLQYHATSGGGGEVAYHGHGVSTESNKQKKIQRFYEMVHKGLRTQLPDDSVEIVLCGDSATVGHFRDVVKLESISEDHLDENVSNLSDEDLKEKIQSWLGERARCQDKQLFEDLGTAVATDRGSKDLGEIVLAARMGRVDTLLIKSGARQYGSFDENEAAVRLEESAKKGSLELVNDAACQTALADGRVVFFDDDNWPDDLREEVCAIYRY
ncbi:MAG: hypothetical protein Q7Q71_08990 [Verrucomicrobiota bacterium JB023]|nr:hypothetical protein [Verrucomicrobiota bacterium JB023]